ncbi:PglZ domain-containing protein [bacterium]|nr:MAG: PglZ domain-containing protein [bacterium]
MTQKRILWIDDEINQLRAHIKFLEKRGYKVLVASSASDGIDLVRISPPDVVLLDEMMPGMDGISAIEKIRHIDRNIPIIMVTKSEEENLMEEAIGQQIADYIVKPVNPLQILTSLKKLFESERIVAEKLTRNYTQEYQKVYEKLSPRMTPDNWLEIADWLTDWDLLFDQRPDLALNETHQTFRKEVNTEFAKYIIDNYTDWIHKNPAERPTLSVDIFRKYVLPHIKVGKNVMFVVIDCMRYDQWMVVEPLLSDYYNIQTDLYFSILPSATPYARNSLFAGLFPSELQKAYPKIWNRGQSDPSSHNRYEHELMDRQLDRLGIELPGDSKYIKVLDPEEGESLVRRLNSFITAPLSAVVVNFLDILAHSRAASDILRELSADEKGYRAVMKAWFTQSALFEALKQSRNRDDLVIVITTDHGSTIGKKGIKAYGKRDTSTNLRYKYGDNLNVDPRGGILIKDPQKWKLPTFGITTNYIIAKEDYYLVYPTNFNEYERHYKNSILHGGISIEEMVIPVTTMTT